MCYILAAMILLGLQSTEDDHDVLDNGVAILSLIIDFLLALVWVVALRRVLASPLGDLPTTTFRPFTTMS